MRSIEKIVLLNSTLIRISSALLTTVIHELGHFLISVGLGNSATLYHNRVETHTENLDIFNQLAIPMGGPVISLLQGIICIVIYKKIKNGIISLFVLWLGIGGLMAFFGYMMIAPLFTMGDTGKILQLLEVPMLWQIGIAIGSLVLFIFLLIRFHLGFEHFIPEDIHSGKELRAKWAGLLIMYPILIGILVNTIMQFPIVYFLSLLPSLTMPFMLFMVYGQMILSKTKIEKAKNKDVTHFSMALIIVFILTIILYRSLVWGFTI